MLSCSHAKRRDEISISWHWTLTHLEVLAVMGMGNAGYGTSTQLWGFWLLAVLRYWTYTWVVQLTWYSWALDTSTYLA